MTKRLHFHFLSENNRKKRKKKKTFRKASCGQIAFLSSKLMLEYEQVFIHESSNNMVPKYEARRYILYKIE